MAHDASIPGMETGIELLDLLSPYLRECGDTPRPAWRLETRCLLDYLLVYIAEGEGRFCIEGREYAACPNDLFWIGPNMSHEMEGFGPRMVCPYAHFDLIYRPLYSHWHFSIPGGMRELEDFAPLCHPPVQHPLLDRLGGRIRARNNRRVGALLREVCMESAHGRPYAGLRQSALLLEILVELLRGMSGASSVSGAQRRRLEAAAERMLAESGGKVRLEEVALDAGFSPSHFRSLFRRHYGLSPRGWLRRARIRRARELMVHTSLSLTAIAGRVGFDTVYSFSRAFREVEGLSPSAYRREGRSSGSG